MATSDVRVGDKQRRYGSRVATRICAARARALNANGMSLTATEGKGKEGEISGQILPTTAARLTRVGETTSDSFALPTMDGLFVLFILLRGNERTAISRPRKPCANSLNHGGYSIKMLKMAM